MCASVWLSSGVDQDSRRGGDGFVCSKYQEERKIYYFHAKKGLLIVLGFTVRWEECAEQLSAINGTVLGREENSCGTFIGTVLNILPTVLIRTEAIWHRATVMNTAPRNFQWNSRLKASHHKPMCARERSIRTISCSLIETFPNALKFESKRL